MKLIKKMFWVDVTSEEKMLVNGLEGVVLLLSGEEAEIVSRWKNSGIPNTLKSKEEQEMLDGLKSNGFVVADDYEEREKEKRLIEKLKLNGDKVEALTFVITYDCNFACPYCFEKANKNTGRIMTKEMVDRICDIHKYDNVKSVGFFGGEPFLPDTQEIVGYILKKFPEAFFSAYTNGYYLEEFLGLFKERKIARIAVTIDGTENKHNETRKLKNGDGTFEKIVSGIEKAIAMKIPIVIRMNLCADNVKDCLEFQKIMCDRINVGSELLAFEMQPQFQLSYDERTGIQKQMYGLRAENAIHKSANPLIKMLLGLSNKLEPRLCTCGANGKSLLYDVKGDIYSCLLSVGDVKARVGTYLPKYELYSNSLLRRDVITIPECRECAAAYLCGGGCGYSSKKADADTFLKPNCYQFLHEIKEVLPSIYRKENGQL